MSSRRCCCPCHEGSFSDRMRADGVSVTDAIEAAIACDTCRGHHTAALLDPDRPTRAVTESGEFSPPSRWTPEKDAADSDTTNNDEDGG